MERLSDQLLFLLSFEEFGDAGSRSGRMEEFQPMLIRGIFIFERIDLDDVSGLRDITDRFYLSVDDGVFEAQSDIAMHGESEIQHSAADRQFDDISLRGVEENALFENLDIELFFELLPIIQRFVIVDDILQFLDPFALLLRDLDRSIVFHIRKMRRNSELRHIIHFMSPDLDFRREREHSEYGGVDALIAVEFGDRDIIFDLFDERRIIFMDDSEDHIAVAHRFGDHPIRQQIHHGADLCRLVSGVKFFKHPIGALDPSFDLEILDSFFLKHSGQRPDPSFRVFLSFAEIFFQIRENISERLLFQNLEGTVFEI